MIDGVVPCCWRISSGRLVDDAARVVRIARSPPCSEGSTRRRLGREKRSPGRSRQSANWRRFPLSDRKKPRRSAGESLFGVLDAIGWDTAAMSVPQQEAGGLCEQSRIGGLGDAAAEQE